MGVFNSCLKKSPAEMVGEDTPNPLVEADFKTDYEVLNEVLGEGAYSVVRPALVRKTGEKVAVKIINRAGLSKEDEKDLRTEVSILKQLQHPNIVRLIDFFEEPLTYIIVMEYVVGGELFDRIVKKAFYNEKEARDCVAVLFNAVKFLHDRNIVHRDLKPENLLLKSLDDDADLKLADFGFATEVHGNKLTQQCGTPGYVAPEIISRKPYGLGVDMWSLGVICYILLGGYPPFHHDNQRELFKLIQSGKFEFHADFWGTVSADAMDLISKLLTVDPKARLTIDQALQHPWMQSKDAELVAHNLDANKDQLKKYLARRRFKKAILAHVAVGRFKKGITADSTRGYSDSTDGVDETSPTEPEEY